MNAKDWPAGQQRRQGNPARVVRGEHLQRGLVGEMLIGRLSVERQQRLRGAGLNLIDAPLNEFEYRNLLAQQASDDLRVHAELLLFVPGDVEKLSLRSGVDT